MKTQNSKLKTQNSKKGFTLIELLVVVGVISVLSVGILSAVNPVAQFQKANDGRRKSDFSQIQRALESFYQDNGRYPANYSATDYRIKGLDGNPVNWGASWQPYMNVLPKDPNYPSKTYIYYSSSDGQAYWLYATLQRVTDPQLCNSGNACTSLSSNGIASNACGGICNYGVSSPNVSP